MLRNIFTLFILSAFLFSCSEGPQGLPGPQGPQGPEGPQGEAGSEGFTFEWEVDFVAPDFNALLSFPSDFTMLESDVAIVYALWGTETVDGQELEIWRQLPQTVFTDDGLLLYNFDFTVSDVSVFMESDFPLTVLGPNLTDDWIFRVVVIPSQFNDNGRVSTDFSNYYEVVERFGLVHKPVDEKYKNIQRPAVKE